MHRPESPADRPLWIALAMAVLGSAMIALLVKVGAPLPAAPPGDPAPREGAERPAPLAEAARGAVHVPMPRFDSSGDALPRPEDEAVDVRQQQGHSASGSGVNGSGARPASASPAARRSVPRNGPVERIPAPIALPPTAWLPELGEATCTADAAARVAESFVAARGWSKGRRSEGFLAVVAERPLDGPASEEMRRAQFRGAMESARLALARQLEDEAIGELRKEMAARDPWTSFPKLFEPSSPALPLVRMSADLLVRWLWEQERGRIAGEVDAASLMREVPRERFTQPALEAIGSEEFRRLVRAHAIAQAAVLPPVLVVEQRRGDKLSTAVVLASNGEEEMLRRSVLGGPTGEQPAGGDVAALRGPSVVPAYGCMQGVQFATRDGKTVLLGFGSSTIKSRGQRAEDVAAKRAEVVAIAEVREFLAELLWMQSCFRGSSRLFAAGRAARLLGDQGAPSERHERHVIAGGLDLRGGTVVAGFQVDGIGDQRRAVVVVAIPLDSLALRNRVVELWGDDSEKSIEEPPYRPGSGGGSVGVRAVLPPPRPASDRSSSSGRREPEGSGSEGEEP
jgi:hypothetical protein